MSDMRRREFITLLGGAAAWPLAARAQQRERMRRIGVLTNLSADDPEEQVRMAAFSQGLQQSGWTVGYNTRIDYRWGAGERARYQRYAAELVALSPDVLLATNTSTVRALRAATNAIPIVFASATDPVAGGLVASLAHPGGNITGFTAFEFSTSGKWLELLKEIAPSLTRVAVIRDPVTTGAVAQLAAIQAVASWSRIELTPLDVHRVDTLERELADLSHSSQVGLIVVSTALAMVHRDEIVRFAAAARVPAIYPFRPFVVNGGLLSYGPDLTHQYREAATYVARILRGEKPAELPVQAPTKYELVINLKTAKALDIDVPPSLLARADEVIE